jgi:hypothetical protein
MSDEVLKPDDRPDEDKATAPQAMPLTPREAAEWDALSARYNAPYRFPG